MSVWAVVPVKGFARAKSRLTNLAIGERKQLARSMFERVIGVLSQCDAVAGTLVSTDSSEVAAVARELGAEVVRDDLAPSAGGPSGEGIGPVVARALQAVTRRGARSAIVLMSDLPRLEVTDVREVVGLLAQFEVVVVPDRRDRGTNALALSPPDRMATCFGNEDSFERHCVAAMESGARFRVHRNPRIAFDVDVPDDVVELAAAGA